MSKGSPRKRQMLMLESCLPLRIKFQKEDMDARGDNGILRIVIFVTTPIRPREGLEIEKPGGLASTKPLRYDHYSYRDRNWEIIDHENETHPSSRAGHQVKCKLQTKHLDTTTTTHE